MLQVQVHCSLEGRSVNLAVLQQGLAVLRQGGGGGGDEKEVVLRQGFEHNWDRDEDDVEVGKEVAGERALEVTWADGGEAREPREPREAREARKGSMEAMQVREGREGSVEALVAALRCLESRLAGLTGDLGQGSLLLGLEDMMGAAGTLLGDLQGS